MPRCLGRRVAVKVFCIVHRRATQKLADRLAAVQVGTMIVTPPVRRKSTERQTVGEFEYVWANSGSKDLGRVFFLRRLDAHGSSVGPDD